MAFQYTKFKKTKPITCLIDNKHYFMVNFEKLFIDKINNTLSIQKNT